MTDLLPDNHQSGELVWRPIRSAPLGQPILVMFSTGAVEVRKMTSHHLRSHQWIGGHPTSWMPIDAIRACPFDPKL